MGVSHPFFHELDWENIFECTPPHVPDVSSSTDVSNFDVDDLMEPRDQSDPPISHQPFTGHHLPFVGFTFTKDSKISDRSASNDVREQPDGQASVTVDVKAFETKIMKLQKEKSELQRKLEDALKVDENSQQKAPTTPNNASQRKQGDSDKQVKSLEKELAEMKEKKRLVDVEREEAVSKVKELERALRSHSQDKEYAESEAKTTKEKLQSVQKELREAQQQRKATMEEFSELNDKLADIRGQKMKQTRLMREKEEEIETTMNKFDVLRQDLRLSEKNKRELMTQIEELQTASSKDSK